MISWKHSFNRLNEEYEIAKKKQLALDSLLERGKISQTTHDSFNKDIASAIAEIEKQQQSLLEKMSAKTNELQGQIKTLETLLANYEIQHVTGEIDDNIYNLEINLLTTGLETAKHELQTISDAANQLTSPQAPATIEAAPVAATVEPAPAEVPPVAATLEVIPEVVIAPEPAIQEPTPAPVVDAAPIVEEPAPAPVAEVPSVEAPAEPAIESEPAAAAEPTLVIEATPEPAPVMEAPAEPAPVTETPVEQALVIEAPPAETPVEEAPAVETPTEQPVVEVPVIETPTAPAVDEPAPVAEVPILEEPAPVAEAPIVESDPVIETAPIMDSAPAIETAPTIDSAPIDATAEPAAEEIVMSEPIDIAEEEKVEKAALDEFEVTQPDIVQKELLQAVEEIAENPFQNAPLEAHDEATAETPIEVSAETQPIPIQSAKEQAPDTYTSEESKE